ncbi:MAG: LysM peptidoglycan-binding domain-containing protein [Gammaproteobacteria bacterium]|nr:LysM peptidoglycan-binding domain-containing protein [Gammaproteobacteria bacterium]
MRKYLNRIYTLSPLLLGLLLVSSGCSTTPNEPDTSKEMVEEAIVMEEEKPTTVVYEVDNADDVDVQNLPTSPQNNQATLKASAPEQYVVQKGDTLWDLSNQFLNQPWYWPEIWYMNPQVQNPHLIYPGDVINVFYVGGKPYITVNGDNRVSGIERLSPVMRGEPIEASQKVIPIQIIEQFLTRPLVVSLGELESSPHIVASKDGRLVYGANDLVYVRDAGHLKLDSVYNVYRPGSAFNDPITNELIGYEAIHVGDGKLTKEGEPASLYLTDAKREILRGDRIIEVDNIDADSSLYPREPDKDVNGHVIYLHDAISQVGAYQIVVTNIGTQHGIEKGHVLAISRAGNTVVDPYAEETQDEMVALPNEQTADAIVFRVFEGISYLFILDANRPVRTGDIVTSP